MASITSIHLPKVAFGSTAANLRSLFHGRVLNLLKGLTVGQAVPEIPLSVGSKLKLVLFAKFPYTSPHFSAYAYCMPCIYTCIIIRV